MTGFIVLVLIGLVILLWRRSRKAAKRRAAVVTAAPLVRGLNGEPVTRTPPSRYSGHRGAM